MTSSLTAPQTADIAVIGGGPNGLAAALAFWRAGFSVKIFGPRPEAEGPRADMRQTALIGASVDLLKRTGIWEACLPHTAPITAVTIIDQTRRLLRAPDVTFTAQEGGLDVFAYNIPNARLVGALLAAIGKDIPWDEGIADDLIPSAGTVIVRTQDGAETEASLIIGADGRKSLARTKAGISSWNFDYKHTAIACNFEHTAPHNGMCVELHRTQGPFTCVPLPGNTSSLVWEETPERVAALLAMDEAAFAREIEGRIGGFLGRITAVGPRGAFPLSALVVRTYGSHRSALIGDAAHGVPPIGAQGLNLGFRDVAELLNCVTDARRRGEDIGSDAVLSAYTNRRRADVLSRTAAADMLNRTLISNIMPR
jgi:2-octaprenyl-6-methoxyphenol hydroxylase